MEYFIICENVFTLKVIKQKRFSQVLSERLVPVPCDCTTVVWFNFLVTDKTPDGFHAYR